MSQLPNLADRIKGSPPPDTWFKALVTGFVPGPPHTASIKPNGAGDPVDGIGMLAGYAPTIGDWVWVVVVTPGLWLIVNKEG